MWKDIIRFELSYRKSRAASYIYFVVMFLIGFIVAGTDMVESFGSGNEIKENSPYVLMMVLSIGSVFGLFITSAIMGVGIVRDFEHKTEALFFTTQITKFDYLIGRFLGSLLVLTLVFLGLPLGAMFAEFMPWKDADKLGPFNALNYFNPFFLILLPNAFFFGSIFFAIGALSRKMIVIFMQGLVFFLFFLASSTLFSKIESKKLGAFIDPFGLTAAGVQTEYWSIAQKSTQHLALEGEFLYNRLLWLAVSVGILTLMYFLFSFKTVLNPVIKKSASNLKPYKERFANGVVPYGSRNFGDYWLKIKALTHIYFKETALGLPYIVLTVSGLFMFFIMAYTGSEDYATQSLPLTFKVLSNLSILYGFFAFVMIVMFTGDLVWKERALKMDLIQDIMPMPTWITLFSKLLALLLCIAVLMALSIVAGIIYQLTLGYTDFDLSQYFQSLFIGNLTSMLIFILVAFFIQVVVNNKFLGMGLSLLLILVPVALGALKIRSNIFKFNSGGLGTFSEMNGFGHMYAGFSTLKMYWFAFGVILFILATIWAVRGTEEKLKTRLLIGKYSLSRKVISGVILATIAFVSSGFAYYYNTQRVNVLKSEKEEIAEMVSYEKTLKKFENLAQPKIVDVQLHVDIFPETRDMKASGSYWLKNKTDNPISEIHVNATENHQFFTDKLTLNRVNSLDKQYVKDFGYYIFKLKEPLLPSDSLKLDFKMRFETKGFEQGMGNPDIVENGTFFSNSYFPSLGYADWAELSDPDKRKENGLPEKERATKRDDPKGRLVNYTGDDADIYTFEATVSTSPNQTAIVPGYLEKKWEENGRAYFKYKMDAPIKNMYSIVSAKYDVKKENYKGISLEIYYHPKHTYNLDRMMEAMKKSLDYYQEAFGPYQYRQLRIMEFPRYRGFAQSFANTIPFGESMGFVSKVEEDGVDYPTFVTAHEIAHQWWGHQLIAADVQGAGMLSESFSEYSALMLMTKGASEDRIRKFTRNELDYYLKGRSGEDRKELPLALVEGQQYIQYYKGSLILYAIQDIIGEKTLNNVLKKTLERGKIMSNSASPVYPTTRVFTEELSASLPDSLQYLVTDWINQITFYDLKAEKAKAIKKNKGYEIMLELNTKKTIADSLGKEADKKFSEWIWVGAYTKDQNKKDSLVYYQRHKIHSGKQTVKFFVKQKPTSAGIDPKTLLIDRKPDDNMVKVD